MTEKAYEVVHLDELDRFPVDDEGLLWRPVRRRLGITAFGTNAYTAERGTERVVEEHHEEGGHEELYFVATGRATFVLGDEEIDAPAGTFIHAEPGTKRGAVATEPNTTVLAIGAKPGVPHEISAWEEIFVGLRPLQERGRDWSPRAHGQGSRRASGCLAGALQRGLPRGADEESRSGDRASPARDRARSEGKGVRGQRLGLRLDARRPGVPGLSGTANIGDLALRLGDGPSWAMVRTHFDIQAFGVNAYIAEEPGIRLIEDHDELGERAGRHEELYFVSSGRATFTVNGDEIDAPAGTFVFVRDPAAKRTAIAEEAETTIVIVGGKPGEAFSPSPWERNAEGLVHFANEDWEQAVATYERFLDERPGDAGFLYNLACAESRLGRKEQALEHLRQAVETEERFKRDAVGDPDFDAIRDDPEFSAITGQADPAGAGS